MLGASNGWHQGTQYFACPENRGVFVPYSQFALDERFSPAADNERGDDGSESPAEAFGGMECPPVPGFVAPLKISEVSKVSGRNRGIQGHQNSCYLDATLFAMFAFTRWGRKIEPTAQQDIRLFCKLHASTLLV